MVAPAPHIEPARCGTLGEPIRRSVGSTWTEREFRALKAKARYGSVSKVIRDLIPPELLVDLIHANESSLKKDSGSRNHVSRSTRTVGKNNSAANN